MYREHYPAFHAVWRALRKLALLAVGLFLFFTFIELAWAGLLLYRFHPLLGYTFGLIVFLFALGFAWRALTHRHDQQTLIPPTRPAGSRVRQRDLEAYCAYLVHRMKRLSLNARLAKEDRLKIRQRAYDIEGLLGSHPLIDDLTRAISRAEVEVLEPAMGFLDQQAEAIGRAKIQAVIEDAVKPPFPVITPLVVLYHQLTLVTAVTDIYLGQVSLREYGRVIRDVMNTLSRGQFFRTGQRLFEGVYANSPPLGRAVDDLGQAITCTWLTWTVTRAAAYRCRTLYPWQLDQSVEAMDRGTPESLVVVRDTVINEVLPLLKLRIRHSVAPGIADASGFSESVGQGVAKAIDSVVLALRAQHPEKAIQRSRLTQPGLTPADDQADRPAQAPAETWRKKGPMRRWIERVQYTRQSKHLS